MASFVSEILSSAGQMETQEASSKLKQLSKKIEGLKIQLRDLTVNRYSITLPKLASAEELVSNVDVIKADMDEVADRIEHQIKGQLNMSTSEFQNLTSQLEDTKSVVTILEKLVQLQGGLQIIESSTESKEYSKAADGVLMVKSLLASKIHRGEEDIHIFHAIKTEAIVRGERLISDLIEMWKGMVWWVIPDEKIKTPSSPLTYELHLSVKSENSDILKEVVKAMGKLGILYKEMQRFFELVMRYVIKPVVSGQCELSQNERGQDNCLTVTVKQNDNPTHPSPMTLYSNLDMVQKFLTFNLLNVVVTEHEGDKKPAFGTLMSYFQELVSEKILDMVVKECLIPSIPSNNKDLTEFNDVIIITQEFNSLWMKAGLISTENTALLEFVENVNALFANKKCQEILEKARKLMTTEIHNMITVSHDKPLGELPPLIEGEREGKKSKKIDFLNVESPLSGNTFRLPSCKISSSIQEVMTIAYETLHEATGSSSQCAVQMYCTVRHMFELFCSVFPAYHKQSLETLPQFTALHYNNCMYIAHHLMTLGYQFSKKLPESINVTFVDLVQKIRQLGTEFFLRQMVKQKEQMSEYLNAANGFLNVSQKDVYSASEKAVKQTLHQLQHLKKVWQEVLPPSNYRKAIGGLVSSLAVEITESILSLEDISAEDTKHLSWLINMIIDRVPQLFEIAGDTTSNSTADLQRNVAKWQRFKELDLILSASMIDIVDRWAAGKGPLAVAFTANEVKQLIRALFQNTDRRAAMLAKIK